MADQGASFEIAAATIGGRQLGPATALVDEDVLRLLLLEPPDAEKAIQFRYESILGVGPSDGSVVVSLRDGRGLAVVTTDAAAFRSSVLAACRSLPEVTRTLRALGSRRSVGGSRRNPSDGEARFFAPFIRARRRSMEARDAMAVIRSFDAIELARSLAGVIVAFSNELSGGLPARQRALEAEMADVVEKLDDSLTRLRDLAVRAGSDVDDLGRWRAWADGVVEVFAAADRAWVSMEPIVSRR